MPPGVVKRVGADPAGRLWLASSKGLHVLAPNAQRWRSVGQEIGVPGAVEDLHVDRTGAVWAQNAQGNYRMGPDETRFSFIAAQQMPARLLEAPDGTMWSSDPGLGRIRRITPGSVPHQLDRLLQRVQPGDLLSFDRHGNIWIPLTTGMVRVTAGESQPQVQVFEQSHGLSGQRATSVFEDREGNVWVATDRGLDQFRHSRMREIILPDFIGEARPLAAGPEGIWIDRSYLRNSGASPEPLGPSVPLAEVSTQLYRDRHGVLWSGGFDGLWRLEGGRRTQVALPEELRNTKRLGIFSIVMDSQDGLWVSFGPRGGWRWKDGNWTRNGGVDALAGFTPTTIASGPGASLWFGSVGNRAAILRDGRVSTIGAGDGLNVGTVMQIVPTAAGAWLSGDEGLVHFGGKRVVRIEGEGGEQFAGATGLVLDPGGALWANTARGLVVVPAGELRQAVAAPGYRVRYRRYDENDGLRGAAAPMLPLPSLVRTPSGELLVSTTSGVYSFDPAGAVTNRIAPPVHVTGISAGGSLQPGTTGVKLPAAPGEVRIDYTALSLAVPQRVRFQYKLEGIDAGWQDAGSRRSAFYTRLDPGHYIFRVKAANDDGLWNEQGASMDFDIPPTMLQSAWFKVACALALALGAFALHRLRLRMAVRRLGRMFEARVAERERIARDLHDTLLQSVQGLIMHFRRIALRTPDDAPTRPLMQEALALATEVLEEGRDKVGALRSAGEDADLAALLDEHGRRLSSQHAASFAMATEGAPRRLRAAVLDEVLAIGREAMRNAFLHAKATRIEAALRFGEHDFELVISDDGVGIDPAAHGGRPGHWGIPGMRERAAELGASIELQSSIDKGCTWQLRLPARLAYEGHAAAAVESASMSGVERETQ